MGVVLRIRIPTDEADLRELLDRLLNKGLFCGMPILMLEGEFGPITVSRIETNTATYGKQRRRHYERWPANRD